MQGIAEAGGPIDVFAPSGRVIGRVNPEAVDLYNEPQLSPSRLAEIKRRMVDAKEKPGAFKTWDEIKSRLQLQKNP